MIYLWIYLIIINSVSFALMLIDKKKAQRHLWRISEATLMGASLLGGSLGTFCAMRLFRHKTHHPKFYIGLPVIMGIQFFLLLYFYSTVIL